VKLGIYIQTHYDCCVLAKGHGSGSSEIRDNSHEPKSGSHGQLKAHVRYYMAGLVAMTVKHGRISKRSPNYANGRGGFP
jgi:hypothetical protein